VVLLLSVLSHLVCIYHHACFCAVAPAQLPASLAASCVVVQNMNNIWCLCTLHVSARPLQGQLSVEDCLCIDPARGVLLSAAAGGKERTATDAGVQGKLANILSYHVVR
jgi:hypothetical protein